MNFWKKLTAEERLDRVQRALKDNVDFSKDANLGYPASKLDERVFANESIFLREMPVLNAYIANPNHIGCHTYGTSEYSFKGTQAIEREGDAVTSEKSPRDFKIENLQRDVSTFLGEYRQFLSCCKTDPDELQRITDL